MNCIAAGSSLVYRALSGVLLALVTSLNVTLPAAEIANSQTEFSGVQGVNGWYHGYRNYTDSGRTPNYNPAEYPAGHFIRFAGGSNVADAWTEANINGNLQHWSGTQWDLSVSGYPLTAMGALTAQPNGGALSPLYPAHSGKEEWLIRRWKADELSTVTPVAVTYTHWMASTSGTGTTLYLVRNGTVVDTWTRNSTTQASRTYYFNLNPGDTIDLCLSPLGTTGSHSDAFDSTSFRFTVNDALPAVPLQPDGSLFIPANAADSDGDGILDVWELYYTGNLTTLTATGDYDNDGLTDVQEINLGTNPLIADTDGDGLTDDAEVNTYHTNPLVADTDGDGLTDGAEVNTYHTNPLLADTDGDGLKDGAEIATGCNPLNPDTDGDGISDGAEVLTYLTNPLDRDTDHDGYSDAAEIAAGTNPRDVGSFPGSNGALPQLSITRSGANIFLSWPASASDWMPCWSDDLSPADWKLVPDVPTVSAGQNLVTITTASTRRFFQLRHRGAVVPFKTYEAEDAIVTGGSVVRMTGLPTSTTWSPQLEASGRAFVQLNNTGDRMDFTNFTAANALVIRHCIPDAPTGGGITGTLSLYVNGVFRQKLALSSTYNWLYGDGTSGSNGQSNDPTIANATAHLFWDETRAFITGGLQPGDTLTLQKDADDTALFYRVDLVDLEAVSPPLPPPPAGSYLSVTDYGADGSDAIDDTAAIQNCINDAKAQGKHVWMPAGTYYQSANFPLDGVTVQGAGMWHTNLVSTIAGTSFSGNVGFFIKGAGSKVTDMSITSTAHTTRSTPGGKPFTSSSSTPPTNWTVQNVWITHTEVGFWMTAASTGTVRGCRVRTTYADGININGGSSNNLLEHNHVRGTGDDGLATFSGSGNPICTGNTFRFNTVIAPWSAHNCALWGCDNQLVEDNYWADNAQFGNFAFNLSGSTSAYPITNSIIRRNTLVRGGGNAYGQKMGAIWCYAGNHTISGVFVRDNDIRDSIFRGIHLAGSQSQAITFERNVIDHPGENGVLVLSGVTGTGTFTGNIVRNLNNGFTQFSNSASSPGYTVTLSGNSW